MRKLINYTLVLLFFASSYSMLYADETKDYLVIKLDEFSKIQINHSNPFSAAVLGKGRANSSGEILPVTVKIYPLGKPLQVVKSYVPGNSDEVDDVSRFIADTTNRYVPEVYTGAINSFSSAEYIERLFLNIHYPVSNNFSVGISMYGGIFDLVDNGGDPAISTGMTQVGFEGKYRFNPEFSLYGAVIIGSTHSVVSPGLVGRLEYINRGGVELKVGGNLWTPWVENTVAVYNNGRSNGLNTELTLPFSHSLRLDMNAAVDWRFTAQDAFEVNTFEGTDLSGGARLTWDFFSREYRQLPVEFLNGDYLSMENVSSRVGIFASVQASKYFRRNDDIDLVPVVDDSVDQRLGLSAAYAFTSRLATTAELYVGFDPARKINFGKLYGFNTRLVYIPVPRMRVYGEFALDSEAATGITEGSTWYYGIGANYKF